MISFNFFGHQNILSTHKNTIEFTKESEVTKKGDCILGVKSDFNPTDLKEVCKKNNKIKIKIFVQDLVEEIICFTNKDFDDAHEIVIRKSEFNTKRTFGIKADKVALDINRKIVDKLKNPNIKGKVEILEIK